MGLPVAARIAARLLAVALLAPLAGCLSVHASGHLGYVAELHPDAPAQGFEGSGYVGVGVGGETAFGWGPNVRARFTDAEAGGDAGAHIYVIRRLAVLGDTRPNDALAAYARAATWLGGSNRGFRWSTGLETGLAFCPRAHNQDRVTLGRFAANIRYTDGFCATVSATGEFDLVTPPGRPAPWVGVQAGFAYMAF